MIDWQAIIQEYRRDHRPFGLKELRHFKRRPDFATALHDAARAIRPDEKVYDHQRRCGKAALAAFHRALLPVSADLERAQSFGDLYDLIRGVSARCERIGNLTTYDTALRLGSFMGLRPERVYLHTGTRKGARRLGLATRGTSLPMDALPKGMHELEPWEAEDVLCIFKRRL